MAVKPYTPAALVAAVWQWRRKYVVAQLEEKISSLEDYLRGFVDLPIFDREAGSPKRIVTDLGDWLDAWGFPIKVLGHPCITRSGLEFDRVMGELRTFLGLEGVGDTETAAAFLQLVLEVRRLRSRGYRCGAISKGVASDLAEEIVAGSDFELELAIGADLGVANRLGQAVDSVLAAVVRTEEDREFLRMTYAWMVRNGAPDVEFRDLLMNEPGLDLTPLDILMFEDDSEARMIAQRSHRCGLPTWCALAAAALGVIPNQPAAGGW